MRNAHARYVSDLKRALPIAAWLSPRSDWRIGFRRVEIKTNASVKNHTWFSFLGVSHHSQGAIVSWSVHEFLRLSSWTGGVFLGKPFPCSDALAVSAFLWHMLVLSFWVCAVRFRYWHDRTKPWSLQFSDAIWSSCNFRWGWEASPFSLRYHTEQCLIKHVSES